MPADRVVSIDLGPTTCCKTCNHWYECGKQDGVAVSWGECRPYSPTLGDDCWGVWPRTYANDRCGEWEALKDE